MADIFGGLATPPWITLQDMGNTAARDTAQIGQNFASALSQKRSQDFQAQQVQNKQDFMLQQQQQTIQALQPVVSALTDAQTPQAAWDVVSKNPTWLLNPRTGPFVQKYLDTQAKVASAQTKTIAGKIAIQDSTQFSKDMGAIAPEDRAAIQGMNRNPDGSVSAMQWQALNTAKQTAITSKSNAAQQASIEALQRGDVQSTEVNARGDVIQKFNPPKPTQQGPAGDWVPKTVNIDGKDIHWLQGPKGGMKMINEKGDSIEPSTADLTKLATASNADADLQKMATEKLKTKLGGGAMPLPTTKDALKKGSKYNTSKGVATWDGTQFVQ